MIVSQTMHRKLKIIRNSFEEETKYTICKLGWIFIIRSNTMNDMHFEVEKFAIDRVFRGCVEVVLKSLEFDTFTFLIE